MRYNSKWEPWRDDPVRGIRGRPIINPPDPLHSIELNPYIYKSHVTYIVRALFEGDTDQLRIQKEVRTGGSCTCKAKYVVSYFHVLLLFLFEQAKTSCTY